MYMVYTLTGDEAMESPTYRELTKRVAWLVLRYQQTGNAFYSVAARLLLERRN